MRLKLLTLVTTILVSGITANYCYSDVDTSSKSDTELWPADLLQISSTEAFSKYVLLVDKAERKLLIFERSGESIKKLFN